VKWRPSDEYADREGDQDMMQLDPALKDWLQALAWAIAIAGGGIAGFKALYEVREGRLQRARELRWKQADASKRLVDEMLSDEKAQCAMRLLDWDAREFEIAPGIRQPLTKTEMLRALRVTDTMFTPAEAFIRDCFDSLFYYLSLFEHYIRQDLVQFSDCIYPVEYYAGAMRANKSVLDLYAKTYGFSRAMAFLGRFAEWGDAPPAR
jgi:hypothetical protein